MRYYSIFSGVEAATLAWEPLGWEPACFCEVDEFPSAVLRERWPDVPNLGDITMVNWKRVVREYGAADLVVGGSPCQSFSVAGTRTGLDGASGLMWEYVRCVREVKPRWVLWENVPGALSSSHGEDFRCLLEALDAIGYGLAWRVLDAQFFGVAQRRERVFLVGSLGDRRSAEVLFEPESLRWDSPSSRAKREALAGRAEKSAGKCYQIAGNIINRQPQHGGHQLGVRDPEIDGAFTLTAADRHAVATPKTMLVRCGCAGGGKGALIQDDVSATLATSNTQTLFQPVCMIGDHGKAAVDVDVAGTLTAHDAKGAPSVADGYTVRRLTPRECERLQGMPDDHTLVPYRGKPAEECPDTPRYKAIGNSMAVNVMRWIGERIAAVDATLPWPDIPYADWEEE